MPLNTAPVTRAEGLVRNPALVGIVAEVSPSQFKLNYSTFLPKRTFTSNGDGRGFYRKRLHADSLRAIDDTDLLRRPGEGAKKVDRGLGYEDFAVGERMLDAVVTDKEAKILQKMEGALGDPNVTEVRWVRELMLLAKEIRAANFAANNNNHGGYTTPATLWSDPNADVVSDVLAGISAVRAQSGFVANVMAIPWEVAILLTKNKSIQDKRGTMERKNMTPAGIASLLQDVFGLERVDVMTSIYNSQRPNVNAGFTPSSVWGKSAYLRYEPPTVDFDQICWGLEAVDTFDNEGFDAGVYTFRDDDKETTFHRVKESSDFILMNKELSFAFRSTIS